MNKKYNITKLHTAFRCMICSQWIFVSVSVKFMSLNIIISKKISLVGIIRDPFFIFKLKKKHYLDWKIVCLEQNTSNADRTNKFPLAPMGALAPGSAHARPSAQVPIDTSGIFLAQVSGGGQQFLKNSDQFSR